MVNHYGQHAEEQEERFLLVLLHFPSIISIVTFNFYPASFSNDTIGAGGVVNYKSIISIIGAEYDEANGEMVPPRNSLAALSKVSPGLHNGVSPQYRRP